MSTLYVHIHTHIIFIFNIIKINVQKKVISTKNRKSSYICILISSSLDGAVSYKILYGSCSLKLHSPLTVWGFIGLSDELFGNKEKVVLVELLIPRLGFEFHWTQVVSSGEECTCVCFYYLSHHLLVLLCYLHGLYQASSEPVQARNINSFKKCLDKLMDGLCN